VYCFRMARSLAVVDDVGVGGTGRTEGAWSPESSRTGYIWSERALMPNSGRVGAQDAARGSGIPSLSLGVHCDNQPAQQLYRKEGWTAHTVVGDYNILVKHLN